MRVIVIPLRRLIRLLQTNREIVSPPLTKVLKAAFLPPFGVITVLHRTWARWFGPPRYEASTTSGMRMICSPPDLLQTYVYVFGVWEPDITEFTLRRLNAGDGYIDIGANIGYYTLLAAKLVGATGRVVAIEASPDIYQRLDENISINDLHDRVRIVNKAVSDAPAVLDLYGGPRQNIGATSTEAHRGMQRIGSIDAAPPADLLTEDEIRSARLIKIDVEGGENRVLAGLASLLPQMRDDVEILVELSPQWWSDGELPVKAVLRPYFNAGFHAYAINNNYRPWRYLWPRCIDRPRRLKEEFDWNIKRLDVVLSREDAETL